MKRTIAIFSVLTMLLVALCACGSESKNDTANGGTAAPNTQTENGTNGGGSASAGNDAGAGGTQSGSGDTGAKEERSARMGDTVGDAVGGMIGGAAGAVEGALDSAADSMRGRTGPTKNAGSVGRFEQMVENGRVRDTDGFLADGENRSDNKIF